MKVYLILKAGDKPTVHIIDNENRQVAFPVSQTGELIHQLFEIHSGKTQPITEEELKAERRNNGNTKA